MKLELDFEIHGKPEEVFDRFVDADRDGHLFKKLPNVKSFKQIELKKLSGEKYHFRNYAEGKAPIPAVVSHFILPNMLAWEFYGERDHKKRIIDWAIKTPYFTEQVKAKGKWEFIKEKTNGNTVMHLTLEIRIGIPLFGRLLEQVVAGHTKQNMSEYIELLKEEIYKSNNKKTGKKQ